MDKIIAISTLKSNLGNINIKKYQLIYCTDTKECYYDNSNTNRIQIGCTIQIENEGDKNNISFPLINKIYIVTDTNKLYRFKKEWIEITNETAVYDIISASQELIPTTIIKKGVKYAPKTTASNVYLNDGQNVEEALNKYRDENRKSVIFTRTEFVVAVHDHQRIFDIPFPISNYDLKNFPIIAMAHGRVLSLDEYTLSTTQLILKHESLMKDEIMTFIFNYTVFLDSEGINATTINNIKINVGEHPPINPKDTDTWLDTESGTIKQFKDGKWVDVLDPKIKEGSITSNDLSPELADKITNVANSVTNVYNKLQNSSNMIKKSTYTLNFNSNIVPIGINDFNKDKDTLLVYKNSVYIEQGMDYSISNDNKNIICTDEEIWMGGDVPFVFNFVIYKSI